MLWLFVSGSAPAGARAVLIRFGEAVWPRDPRALWRLSETLMNLSNPYVGERRAGTVGLPLPGVGAVRLPRSSIAASRVMTKPARW